MERRTLKPIAHCSNLWPCASCVAIRNRHLALSISPHRQGEYKLPARSIRGWRQLHRAQGRAWSLPGPGWQLIASQGKRGAAGEKGERGPPGPRGDAGASGATIRDWKIDRARYVATPVMSDGRDGPQLELREMFEQFLTDAS
jgi:hypothetical protein